MSIIPDRKRHKTQFPGVVYRWAQRTNAKRGQLEKVYYALFWRDGKKVEAKCGRQFADDMSPARAAVMRAQFMELERDTPAVKRQKRKSRLTIQKLWALYDAEHQEGRTPANHKYLVQFLAPFMDKTPDQLSTSALKAFAAELGTGKSPQTVKHVLALLKRIIKHGYEYELCPMPGALIWPKIALDNQKTEILTQEQIKRLLEALDADHDQNLACLMRLALFSGIRRSALLALEWSDIDLEKGFITLRGASAKNGKTSTIPLSGPARAVIEKINRVDSPYLFPGREGGKRVEIRRFTKRIAERAGLPADFRPLHGLRHVFASVLASNGVDLFTIQKLLTQNSPQMAARYSHLADEALRRGVEAVAVIEK